MASIMYSAPATYPYVSAVDPLPWMDEAVCAQVDPDLFFPVRATGVSSRWAAREAKSVCAVCPLATREACLEYGMSEDLIYWGIYGGRTPNERQALRAERRGVS